jgi:hypothetical protein
MRTDPLRRGLVAGCVFGLWLCAFGSGSVSAAQTPSSGPGVELDRIVSRVHGRIITQSDIRQARDARLVDDVSSDAAARRALENRWLILAEISRAAPLPAPTDADLAAHRSEWQASAGGRTSMPEAEIQTWMRDDLRIRAYLDRQFGMLPPGERDRARAEWVARLRQRASLD